MEIHPLKHPPESLKEFLLHICVVTVGILIALGLESIRETAREHRIVDDSRRNFEAEYNENLRRLSQEIQSTRQVQSDIDAVLKDLPTLRENPTELEQRIRQIQPGFYFFSSTSWDAALSTGALGHMEPAEANRFAIMHVGVQNYTALEAQAFPAYVRLQSFFHSHTRFTESDLDTGRERLLDLRAYEASMEHVATQFQASLTQNH